MTSKSNPRVGQYAYLSVEFSKENCTLHQRIGVWTHKCINKKSFKSAAISPLEHAQGWERNQKVIKELEVISDESSEGGTRMLAVHQQRSSKGRVGHTLPENDKRQEEAEVAVQAT